MQSNPTIRLLLSWSAVTLITGLLVWWLAPVLTPFVVSAVLAYILLPLVQQFEKLTVNRIPRVITVLLAEIILIVTMLAFFFLVIPLLVKQWPLIKEQLPLLITKLHDYVSPLLMQWGVATADWDLEHLQLFLRQYLDSIFENGMDAWLRSLQIGGSVLFAIIGNLILIPVALFYFLYDGKKITNEFAVWVPQSASQGLFDFLKEADQVLGEYLRGQIVVMLILSVYYVAALYAFGLSMALPIGLITGLLIFIPYLGFGVGLILATLSGFLQMSPMDALLMVGVVYGLGQLIESFVLTPRLIGERIGLHPLAVIFALLAFGQLLGFVGVLIALPASAVLLVAIRRLHQVYVNSKWFQGT
ncbi:MAG: AI-2E family transporter [Betaproteobacteria bacterium]|jgi:predicted PurR-regulated permease PerM